MTNRLVALAAGQPYYTSAKVCRRGHRPIVRITANGGCVTCGRTAAALAYREGRTRPAPHRTETLFKWNNSAKGLAAKQRWALKDPRRAWLVHALGGAKARARERGLPFNLDRSYLDGILPTHCPVLGYELGFQLPVGERYRSATIDRLDPKQGYVKGNVAIISQRANAIKSDAALHEIEAVVHWLKGR